VSFVTATLGRAYAASGKIDKARAMIAELRKAEQSQHVSAIVFAQLHAALGEKSEALDALERAYDTRSKMLHWTGRDPVFKILHAEPRFTAMLTKLNLRIV
jgi:predicted Zn-dependent protease